MGASNIKIVKITRNSDNLKVLEHNSLPHQGNAAKTLKEMLVDFNCII